MTWSTVHGIAAVSGTSSIRWNLIRNKFLVVLLSIMPLGVVFEHLNICPPSWGEGTSSRQDFHFAPEDRVSVKMKATWNLTWDMSDGRGLVLSISFNLAVLVVWEGRNINTRCSAYASSVLPFKITFLCCRMFLDRWIPSHTEPNWITTTKNRKLKRAIFHT